MIDDHYVGRTIARSPKRSIVRVGAYFVTEGSTWRVDSITLDGWRVTRDDGFTTETRYLDGWRNATAAEVAAYGQRPTVHGRPDRRRMREDWRDWG